MSAPGSPESSSTAQRLMPKKTIACLNCRRRKIRCDFLRPICTQCTKSDQECTYDETRKKTGPKKGYVKALHDRLARMESVARRNDADDEVGTADESETSQPYQFREGMSHGLPEPRIQHELDAVYFEKIHQLLPVLHISRFAAARDRQTQTQTPLRMSLRFAIWALAAGLLEQYQSYATQYYERARAHLEHDEMWSSGEGALSLGHCQALCLLAFYEQKDCQTHKAWNTTGRAVRLSLMLGLHRLDTGRPDIRQCLPPPTDWIELEERRRTFWLAFWGAQLASLSNGWPSGIDEEDIMTDLPASDHAFQNNSPEETRSLVGTLNPSGELMSSLSSSFSAKVAVASLFGRQVRHMYRSKVVDTSEEQYSRFWDEHFEIEVRLQNLFAGLTGELRLPEALEDPQVVFLHLCLHTVTICLHQAAIFKTTSSGFVPHSASGESKMHCITAAAEVASILRLASYSSLSNTHPYNSFFIYVAAGVFIQYLKARPEDQQIAWSLEFLRSALELVRSQSSLGEVFFAQLELDLAKAGIPGQIPGDLRVPDFMMADPTNPTGIATKLKVYVGNYEDIALFTSDPMDENEGEETNTNILSTMGQPFLFAL